MNDTVAKLIRTLSKVDPRNVSEIARKVGLSTSLTHYYLKRMTTKGLVRIVAKVDDSKIGLRPATVFINSNLALRDFLLEAVHLIDILLHP